MPILKNKRHEKFALGLLQGVSMHDAALVAGYSPKYVDQTASRLYRNVEIFNRVRELFQEVVSNGVMTVQERMERLSEIGRGRLSDFVTVGADGAYFDVGPEKARSGALASASSRTIIGKDGADDAVIISVGLHNPIKAIEALNDMENGNGKGGKTINIITDKVIIDARETLNSAITRLATRIRETEDPGEPD